MILCILVHVNYIDLFIQYLSTESYYIVIFNSINVSEITVYNSCNIFF